MKISESKEPKKVELKAPSREDNPIIPYPQRLKKNEFDNQFGKFMEIFKKLNFNFPFVDVLEQMPSYVKFMKDIVANKMKMNDYETIAPSEECSAILQKKLPLKIKDPGSFTIPCSIGNSIVEKALCDLGASINLMLLSIFKKLGLGEANPTTITLQSTDRFFTHPLDIIEDVLVKAEKFIFLMDFIVLDMEEDKEVPIILGRSFLATGWALIGVQKGELRLRVEDEEATFNVFNSMKHPIESDSCFRVDIVEAIVSSKKGHIYHLETSLVYGDSLDLVDEEAKDYVMWMDSFGPNNKKYFESLRSSPTYPIPLIEKPTVLEEKPLPSHLKHAYLGASPTLPVIILSYLSQVENEKLLRVLREHKKAIRWCMVDIKGIRPSMCMNRILLEDDSKPTIEA